MRDRSLQPLETAIEARATRSGVNVGITRLRYYNRYLYARVQSSRPSVLYVGVGDGFDAVLALNDGLCESIVGVDPYIASDGNGDAEYAALQSLIVECELELQASVHRMRIEEYSAVEPSGFDLIICNQVLHHIFWTEQLLSRSRFHAGGIELFSLLASFCAPGGTLVLGEACRHGLRPLMSKLGWPPTVVDYTTKQPWQQWDRVAREAGWERRGLCNYVPHRLRNLAWLCDGPLGRLSACETYFLYYHLPE